MRSTESERSIFAVASNEAWIALGGIVLAGVGLVVVGRSRAALIRAIDGSMTWRFVAAFQIPNVFLWLIISNPAIELPASGGLLMALLHTVALGVAAWRWHTAWLREGGSHPGRDWGGGSSSIRLCA